MKKTSPDIQSLTSDQANKLFDEINASNLSQETKNIVVKGLNSLFWLMNQYQTNKRTIAKLLKKLFVGFTTEKIKPSKVSQPEVKSPPGPSESSGAENSEGGSSGESPIAPTGAEDPKGDDPINPIEPATPFPNNDGKKEGEKKKGHGHRAASNFAQAKIITINHSTLKAGDSCPLCPLEEGRVYDFIPGTILFIHGQSPLEVTIIKLQALRCSSCNAIFKVPIPEVLATHNRTTPEAKAIAALFKYKGGMPFYRLDMLTETLGARITKSEVWEMVESAAIDAMPAYLQLYTEAAKAETILVDDTAMPILELMKENEINKKS